MLLAGGASGRFGVPSGASTGTREALELRDGDKKRTAARASSRPSRTSTARSPRSSRARTRATRRCIDRMMIELDGTPNKGRLGANAMLGVSMAVARAAAEAAGLPLYRYVGGAGATDAAGAA